MKKKNKNKEKYQIHLVHLVHLAHLIHLVHLEKKSKFPILSNLARKYLAVSATSTASERLFSDAGNLLTNKRTRMKPTLFKKIMFLKRNSSKLESIYPAN